MLYAFNKGEVCTCSVAGPDPGEHLRGVHGALPRRGSPRSSRATRWTPTPRSGPQVSKQQIDKIASYVEIGRNEGAEVLIGGQRAKVDGEFADGYYFQPTVLKGDNKMRVFQEEIFGPVLAVTTFKDDAEALEIANDTLYGLGAGVWTRDGNRAYKMGRKHQGRPGLDQLLPPVPRGRGVRRLQDLRHRPREPPDDARPLQPDQEPAGQLQHQPLGFF